MQELLLGPVTIWFGVPALVGTVFFALRMTMMLAGGDTDGGVSVDADVGDIDSVAESGSDPADSTHAFKVLSLQAIASFLMGYGWGGLGAFRGGGWPFWLSVGFALLCGLGMVWLLAKLLRFVYGLQSSGTLETYHALEAQGTVYTQVPAARSGKGEVRVVIGERARFYNAVTEGEVLPRDTKIRVVEINEDDNSVTVTRA